MKTVRNCVILLAVGVAMAGIGVAQVQRTAVTVQQVPPGANPVAAEAPYGVRYYPVENQGIGGMTTTTISPSYGQVPIQQVQQPQVQVRQTARDLREIEDVAYEDGFDEGRLYERRQMGYDYYGANERARRMREARELRDRDRRAYEDSRRGEWIGGVKVLPVEPDRYRGRVHTPPRDDDARYARDGRRDGRDRDRGRDSDRDGRRPDGRDRDRDRGGDRDRDRGRGGDEARNPPAKLSRHATVLGEFSANGKNAREITVGRTIERCYIEIVSGSVIINTVVVRPEKKELAQGLRLEAGKIHKIHIGPPREVSGFRISEDGRGVYRVIVE